MQRFLADEAAGGLVLIASAVVAMLVANSAWSHGYFALLHAETGPVLASAIGPMTVHLWINDALMAVFFLLVGLEIKRELLTGELASASARRLPFIAAAAGMLVPMLVYFLVVGDHAALHRGWAIPAATDIAFAIGVLALLGSRVPPALKLLLTAIAIVDDMGAVAIIAVGYTDALNLAALGGAAAALVAMAAMNLAGVRRLAPYLVAFVALWLLVLASGVHATVAGVLAAMTIPLRTPSPAPLLRLEHALSPWVAFAIVPLFGFANAGVDLRGTSLELLADPLVLAIALGLVVGKQVGVFGAIWLAVQAGIAPRPEGTSWRQVYGMALVAGIGFTMSLFIGGLAFHDPGLEQAMKVGVLLGSVVSAVAGFLVLRWRRYPV